MNRRLDMLYRLLPTEGRGIIDVGTDHAQIPIRLAESAWPGNIFASDIAQAPLQMAREAARGHGVEHRIRFLCCDGLALCSPDAVDTVLIAGMGGDTICGILDRAEWLFSENIRLILQPMTHAEVLRYWLIHNEFHITREAVAAEDAHVYQMFCASLGKDRPYTDAEVLTGNRACASSGDDRKLLLQHERARLQKKTAGLQKAGQQDSPSFRFYENILLELEDLENNADR